MTNPSPLTISVVGLGHIGLPLAAQYASKGHRVRGCDINPAVVDMVRRGEAYADEAGLEAAVREAVAAGRLMAQTDTAEAVRASDVVVVIVPLMVDAERRIDYRAIDSATADIGDGLQSGTLVVYETTLPVGDTRGRFGPMLEARSGLRPGEDFSLAFSPERVYVGRVFEDLRRYPKVVGGVDERSTRRAEGFYRSVLDAEILPLANAETAEFTKLAETTYRDVNIALANEFARFADERQIDVLQSIRAANTQPFSHIHLPGVGVGGHCIPVYPYFYANQTANAEITRLARGVNDGMASYAVERVRAALGGNLVGTTIAILGYAYRENVHEDAFTVAGRLVEEFSAAGSRVLVHDPFYTDDDLRGRGLEPYDPSSPTEVDAVVMQANHSAYEDFDLRRIPGLKVVLDGRNSLGADRLPEGVVGIGIGRTMTGGRDRSHSQRSER